MSYPLSTINTIILSYSILFLLFTTFLSLQPIYFAEAQNSTNAQNNTHQIYIPTTISKEAQEELRKIASNSFDFKSPGPADHEWMEKIIPRAWNLWISFIHNQSKTFINPI